MRYKVVCIRDRAADVFGQPVFVAALGQALRSFGDEINNKESQMSKHPDDYDLYELGEFDDNEGLFYANNPRQIAVGKEQIR